MNTLLGLAWVAVSAFAPQNVTEVRTATFAGTDEVPMAVRIVRPTWDRTLTPLDRAAFEARPPMRNFYPPLGQGIDVRVTSTPDSESPSSWRSAAWDVPAAETDAEGARAATLVAKRLARDGLLSTLVQATELLPMPDVAATSGSMAAFRARLGAIGVPLDWVDAFRSPDGGDVLAWLVEQRRIGRAPSDLTADLARCSFHFTPSTPGFEASEDSGATTIGALRLQITSPSYWLAAGDGGALDMVRQVIEGMPDTDIVAAIEEKNLAPFLAIARTWPALQKGRAQRITLVPQELPLAQWAQDDAKSGVVHASGDVVTLVPRYPSRGEEASAWVAGESRALEGFAASGRRVARSQLLFQGGNLIVARDPKRAERVLLAGEAEILRNTSLGLTRDQALDAFRAEFGVARVLVLPAVAYHIDYEVSTRVIGDELVCFVVDPLPAACAILRTATSAMERAKKLDTAAADAVRAGLDRGDWAAVAQSFTPPLFQHAVQPGQFRESFAKIFQDGAGDSHVGNFQRVLLAVDLILSRARLPGSVDGYVQAYIDTFHSRDHERAQLVATLAAQGWRTVNVPSLSENDRGIDYLNGIHAPGLFLMPAWGGLFAPLDAAAKNAYERALGPDIRVIPIESSESQRRIGAVRCAISVVPAR